MSDLNEYEKQTRKWFWRGPLGFFRWLDLHRSRLLAIKSDPRVSDEAWEAVKEHI